MDMSAELVLETRTLVGESPCWDDREGVLLFVDIPEGTLHRFCPASGAHMSRRVAPVLAAVALRDPEGLVLALEHELAVADGTGEHHALRIDGPGRLNDGACDPWGRYWIGSAAPADAPNAGALHRIVDREAQPIVSGVSLSNGIDWSPDGSIMYYVDSTTRRVDRFAYDGERGLPTRREAFVTLEPDEGLPDGLCVDAEGGVWLALWDGWQVRRYSADGRLDAVIELPVAKVTSCAFGGHALDELYITTATMGLCEDELRAQPHAGALFRCTPGVHGQRANRARLTVDDERRQQIRSDQGAT